MKKKKETLKDRTNDDNVYIQAPNIESPVVVLDDKTVDQIGMPIDQNSPILQGPLTQISKLRDKNDDENSSSSSSDYSDHEYQRTSVIGTEELQKQQPEVLLTTLTKEETPILPSVKVQPTLTKNSYSKLYDKYKSKKEAFLR